MQTQTNTNAHAHTHAHTQTHARTCTHTHTKLILTTGKPLWQGKATANVDTREYILEKKHIHVINLVRFVLNWLLKIQFNSKLLMFGSFRKLNSSAFLWFHHFFYTLYNDL